MIILDTMVVLDGKDYKISEGWEAQVDYRT